ncbi:hypothetical protein GYMLUDRAFT_240944 [Collybiopsis luxurians FD-317 M1]|nr:hypothetical protein GYMLUDRAFT_240944 [Collybiopsis luxurians FD-317 M1]
MPIVTASEFTSTKLDYLIVGGGNTGLTLGVRLSENPEINVGIIEAGTHEVDVPEINIPGLMGSTIRDPKYDWTFWSTPQRHAASGQPMLQPRGKGLGGSTLINFLGLTRANKDEYDAIERFGNPGWNWESMVNCMKKSENTILSPTDPPFRSPGERAAYASQVYEWNGQEGPVFKTFPTFHSDVQAKIFDTFENLGVHWNPDDGNNGNIIGATTTLNSVDPHTMTRSSAYTAYFQPNAERKNLLILTKAQVVKILFEPSENGLQKATGVEFVLHEDEAGFGDRQILSIKDVSRDIILSAGSFQSPQILELSGIGNPDVLAKHGIECIVPLPGVGENLQDHVCIRTLAELNEDCETVDELKEPGGMERHRELYSERKGHLAAICCVAFAFIPPSHLMDSEETSKWLKHATVEQELERVSSIALNNGHERRSEVLRKWVADDRQAQAEIINYGGHQGVSGLAPIPGKKYTTFTAVLMHPLSRGTVHISSNDPLAPPEIDPNYFSNEGDLDLLLKALKFTLNLYQTSPLRQLVKNLMVPSAESRETDQKLKEWVRKGCSHVYHPVGTLAMIPHEDGGVVDSRLRVYGTCNLRVADCSILPLEMACHTQSVAYAIGEKAAEIIGGNQIA